MMHQLHKLILPSTTENIVTFPTQETT